MHRHHHHFFYHLLRNRELNELYTTMAIRAFALTMSGIFIPIYLYRLGYSFASIFLFFALVAVFNLVTLFPSAKLASKLGLKHTILLSMPFLIIFFLLLFSLERFGWPLWLVAIPVGIHSSLFWFSYHSEFSKFSSKKKRGEQIGTGKIIVALFGSLGPLFGGLILAFLGFKVLFFLVSILLFLSALPLFRTKEVHEPIKFSFEGFFKGHKLKDALAYMGNGIEVRIATIFWPLFVFIFIFNEKYFSLGALASVTFVSSLLATIIISKVSDTNRRKTLRVGAVSNSIVWFLKSFLVTPIQVFIADIVYGFSQTTTHLPFEALSYDKAREKGVARIVIEKEMYLKIGAIIFLGLASIFSDRLIEIFRYAGPLSSLLHLFF